MNTSRKQRNNTQLRATPTNRPQVKMRPKDQQQKMKAVSKRCGCGKRRVK